MINIPKTAANIIDTLEKAGFEAYAVGGCVRDSLMGREVSDWDITTSAVPAEVMRVYSGRRVMPTGLKHGTVSLMVRGDAYEITTYRLDGHYTDGRRPDSVRFTGSLRDDLARRDFTVNAMAYNPREGLVDIFGGLDDIKNRLIRCVGAADERFGEDYLRMMRAYRFAAALNFDIDPEIRRVVLAKRERLSSIAAERIQVELNKLILSGSHDKFLLFMDDLAPVILPEVTRLKEVPQRNPYHDLDAYDHTMEVFRLAENDLTQKLCALLHDTGKADTITFEENGDTRFPDHAEASREIAFNIMKRLKYDNYRIQAVTAIIRMHNVAKNLSRYAIKRRIHSRGANLTRQLYAFSIADCMGKNAYARENTLPALTANVALLDDVLSSGEPIHMTDLAVNGYDVGMQLGIRSGEAIGEALNYLLERVHEDPSLNERGRLLQLLENQ
jgi:tRNA nucleotidyltransferase (CCA-adding enzyme)